MDGIDPPMNAVGRLFDGANIGMDIGNLISNLAGRVMNMSNIGMNIGGRIMNGLQIGLQVLSNIFKAIFSRPT